MSSLGRWCGLSMLLIAVSCGPSGGQPSFRVGAQPSASPPASSVPIAVQPPLFMPIADRPALAAAIALYQATAEAALSWSTPPGILVIFDTAAAQFHMSPLPVRWYVLRWPVGASGRPRRISFAPEWGMMLVADRRFILGIPPSAPLSLQEIAAIAQCRALAVFLAPVSDPTIYD